MKILYVSGHNDYAAIMFEEEFKGHSVKDIIAMVESGDLKDQEDRPHPNYGEYDVYFRIIETNINSDDSFIKFIRSEILDYDQSKHGNFYIEHENL